MPCGAKKAKPETPPLRAVRTTDLHSIYSTDVVPSIVRSFRRKCTGSRTDTSYVSEFETPRLVGTYWYVRTYVRTNLRLKSKISRTCDLFQLESSRVSLGKFPGLTHSYGILSRKIASPGKVERTPHSQWSTEENKTTRKQKNTTNNNNNNDDDDREGSKTR